MSATFCRFPSGGVSTFVAVTKYLTRAASKEGFILVLSLRGYSSHGWGDVTTAGGFMVKMCGLDSRDSLLHHILAEQKARGSEVGLWNHKTLLPSDPHLPSGLQLLKVLK